MNDAKGKPKMSKSKLFFDEWSKAKPEDCPYFGKTKGHPCIELPISKVCPREKYWRLYLKAKKEEQR